MLRSIDKWLWPYLKGAIRRPRLDRVTDLIFCFVDHFEPFRGGVSSAAALARVERWRDRYAAAVGDARDADGRAMPHTFFYPAEEYDPACLDCLADLCRSGAGEVEVHLHHRNDTTANLRRTLSEFTRVLHRRHGLLGVDRSGCVRYGFIHGNWALGNSRSDGDWCGVNEELGVLVETGCYADFTFPSAPSPTQPPMVNTIYRACDTGRPRPADRGECVRVWVCGGVGVGEEAKAGMGEAERGGRRLDHRPPTTDHRPLMLITGPLALDWRRRKLGLLPRIENAEVSAVNPATPSRVSLWAKQGIGVAGHGEWIFVKVHTHGCVEENCNMLMDNVLRNMAANLIGLSRPLGWRLHWVSAREMFNLVSAAEDGLRGDAGGHRNYLINAPGHAVQGGVGKRVMEM